MNDKPTVTKDPAAIVAVTATVSSQGIQAGDVSIALSPKVISVFNKLLDEAVAACSGSKKRASCDYNERYVQSVAKALEPGGLLDFVTAAVRASLPTITAGDVAILAQYTANASPLLLVALLWKVLGGKNVLNVSSKYVAGGKNNEGDDKCRAATSSTLR